MLSLYEYAHVCPVHLSIPCLLIPLAVECTHKFGVEENLALENSDPMVPTSDDVHQREESESVEEIDHHIMSGGENGDHGCDANGKFCSFCS